MTFKKRWEALWGDRERWNNPKGLDKLLKYAACWGMEEEGWPTALEEAEYQYGETLASYLGDDYFENRDPEHDRGGILTVTDYWEQEHKELENEEWDDDAENLIAFLLEADRGTLNGHIGDAWGNGITDIWDALRYAKEEMERGDEE